MGTIQIPEKYTPPSFGHHPISTPFAFFICKKTPKSSHLIPKAVLHILPRRISHHLPPLNYDLWLKASCIVLLFIYVFLTQRQSLKYFCLCCITRKLEIKHEINMGSLGHLQSYWLFHFFLWYPVFRISLVLQLLAKTFHQFDFLKILCVFPLTDWVTLDIMVHNCV